MLKHVGLMILMMLAVTACQAPPIEPQINVPRFTAMPPLNVPANALSWRGFHQRTTLTDAPYALEEALQQWAQDRLRLSGAPYLAIVELEEVSLTERNIPVRQGLSGILHNDQDRELSAKMRVSLTLEAVDDNMVLVRQPTARAEVSKRTTLAESASLAERRRAIAALMQELMTHFDQVMSREVAQHVSSSDSIDSWR